MSASSENSPMAFTPGHVSWNELVTTDESAAASFYEALFGWKAVPFGGSGMPYTLFKLNDNERGLAGMMKSPNPNVPSHWLPYIVVADIQAAAKKLTELGGLVLVPPMPVETVGTIAVVTDSTGAVFGLHQP